MNTQGKRDLFVLQEIEQNPVLTQRRLAKKLGIALGLSNLYLKRLAQKGYIKISTFPRSRIRYLLTPSGIAEKSRLTYEYLHYSLTYYRDIRHRFRHALTFLDQSGAKRIVVYGIGELAELAYLSIQESELKLVGFVADEPRDHFLSYPCGTIASLKTLNFDAILISDLGKMTETNTKLRAIGIPASKIVSVI